MLAAVYFVFSFLAHVKDSMTIAEVEAFLWWEDTVVLLLLASSIVSFAVGTCAANSNGSCCENISSQVLPILLIIVFLVGGAGFVLYTTRLVLYLVRYFGPRSVLPILIPTVGVKIFLSAMRSSVGAQTNFVAMSSFVISAAVSLSTRRIALSVFGDNLLGVCSMRLIPIGDRNSHTHARTHAQGRQAPKRHHALLGRQEGAAEHTEGYGSNNFGHGDHADS